jgi:hypothetical protein
MQPDAGWEKGEEAHQDHLRELQERDRKRDESALAEHLAQERAWALADAGLTVDEDGEVSS